MIFKKRLAKEIVTFYHGLSKAEKAEQDFKNTFQKGEIPEEMIEAKGDGASLMDILVREKVLSSNGDFRRLAKEGAITDLDSEKKITDVGFVPKSGMRFKVGKRRFIKIN